MIRFEVGQRGRGDGDKIDSGGNRRGCGGG